MTKQETIYFLDNLKKEYLKIDVAQKIYDKEIDEKLKVYRMENNLNYDYIPNETERQKNIWDNIYPKWYITWDSRKKEIFNTVIKNLESLTSVKLESYKHFRMFSGWLEMPFCK